jgi:hypothetical protein
VSPLVTNTETCIVLFLLNSSGYCPKPDSTTALNSATIKMLFI